MLYGIEIGGSKVLCGAGATPDSISVRERIPTTSPRKTVRAIVDWIERTSEAAGLPDAVGIASFGPIERRPEHPLFGHITTTTKQSWTDTDIVGPITAAVGVPVGWDTDVIGAALGEHRFGAGVGSHTLVYYTLGTGVGGGLLVNGRPPEGVGHPEMGHVRVRRIPGDEFPGTCPFHRDCLEGLVSGPALASRFGRPAEIVDPPEVVAAAAPALAAAISDLVYTVAPDRVIIGGGVGQLADLHVSVNDQLVEALAGYGVQPEHRQDFVVPPALGQEAGLVGALCLAELALGGTHP